MDHRATLRMQLSQMLLFNDNPDEQRVLSEAIATLSAPVTFQLRVKPWMTECFGDEIAINRTERNHRFLEEALELVQAGNCSRDEAHQLVDYVFNREVGNHRQEIGGVMVTLAALCLAYSEDMHDAEETELARVWTKVEQIRAKRAGKPKHSPLPQHVTSTPVTLAQAMTCPEVQAMVAAAKAASHDIDDLVSNSEGVAGLHLNGDVADWESLLDGGAFQEWLSSIETLRAALAPFFALSANNERKPNAD